MYSIQAPPSVFRALDDLRDEDYDIVAAAIFSLSTNPFPHGSIRVRMPKARVTLLDCTHLSGPFWRIRCKTASRGKSGGFRIVYIVGDADQRICIAKVARRGDETYDALERLLRNARLSNLDD